METVTERTNSKGEKTSLITFSIEQTIDKNLWSFLKGGLPGSKILMIMIAYMAVALVFAAAGCVGTMETEPRRLRRRTKQLRNTACVVLLLNVILVPVFVLMNNVTFWRKVTLYRDDLLTEGKDAFYASLDRFLFDGQMGDGMGAALKNFQARHDLLLWLLVPLFLAALLAAVQIRYGRVRNAFLRGILYAFVIVVCVITLFPYYVMFITAFRSNAETLDMYFLHLLPTKWVWSNLKDIVGRGVPRYLLNSVIVAGGSTLLAML